MSFKGSSTDELGTVPQHEVLTQAGVARIEAANAVWNKWTKALLWVGVACISYVYSLDGITTYQYQAYATSSFSMHSALSSIAVAQAIILALSKPFSAKIADTFGRAEAFLLAVVIYVVGFIIVATSNGLTSYGAGAVIYYIGYASVQILVQIVVADLTTLRWRTVVSALCSTPFFVNAFVGSNIANGVINGAGWRWGYAMFCFIIPGGSLPIILTLFWAQWKAKKLGVSATNYHNTPEAELQLRDSRSFFTKIKALFTEIDAIGLILIGFGVALILIPLTVVNNAGSTWNSPSIIAMIVMGFVILLAAIGYEGWVAKVPIVPGRFLRNTTVLSAGLIDFFDFVSFYLQYTYQYSFIAVVKNWSVTDQGYFAYTQNLALTLFAILAGIFILAFRRGKTLLCIGLAVRLLGVGLMIHSKGAHGTVGELVVVQIIQGAGGGIASAVTQSSAQAVVPHQDVAAVTAFILLCAEIGGAVGTAIAGAIWRSEMPGALTRNLSDLLSQTEIDAIYGSIATAAAYAPGSPVREGVIRAYTHVMLLELIPATCLALIPLIASFFIKRVYFGDTQNEVEDEHEIDSKGASPREPVVREVQQ